MRSRVVEFSQTHRTPERNTRITLRTAARPHLDHRAVELREGFGELVNPREYLFDTPGFGFDRFEPRISRPEDRRHGRNAPHFETEEDLARIRGLARWLAGADETAIGVLENLTNYVVGTGFTYTAVERSGGAAPRGLVDAVQRVVEARVPVFPHAWHEGDRVRVSAGPLKDVEGTFIQDKPDSGRLIVSVGLLGRGIAIEVDCTSVTPCSFSRN